MKPFSENWVPDIKAWQAKLGYPKLDANSEKIIVSGDLIGEVWDRVKTWIWIIWHPVLCINHNTDFFNTVSLNTDWLKE